MNDEIIKKIESLKEENNKNVEILRSRMHEISKDVHSCIIPLVKLEKSEESREKSVERIYGKLDKLDDICSEIKQMSDSFKSISPTEIIKKIFENKFVIGILILIGSQFGADMGWLVIEIKKILG